MGKKVSARLPRRSARRIAAAESRRTFLQSLEVIRFDRELVLDGLQGRHRGPCPLARVRRARSEWRPGWSTASKSTARVSAAVIQIFPFEQQAQVPPSSHTRLARPSLAGARAWGHVLLRRPALAKGRAGSDMGTPRPDDAPRARAARAFPPLLVRSRSRPSFDRTRLTSPPLRRAFADPGAPAEPRGSPESGQVRQALRGERVQHHHEAALSAGTSSPARRKTSLRYDP